MNHIGCFISPHGFGHATRTCAVLEALQLLTDVSIDIFTTVDQAVFSQSLSAFSYNTVVTDVGFAQHDAFTVNIEETILQLERFLPFNDKLVDQLAEKCRDMSFILCDISSLGIAVGAKAGVPTVLIENFTWDWLYEEYQHKFPRLTQFSEHLYNLYLSADYHIQTEPICRKGPADLSCGPVFRRIRGSTISLRNKYDCGDRKIVLITLGGIGQSSSSLELFDKHPGYFFVVGGQQSERHVCENVLHLSKFSPYYHPDLIHESDIVVFKSGYSTLAECYQSGKTSVCVTRDGFAESAVLESFAVNRMQSVLVSHLEFQSGAWLSRLNTIVPREPSSRIENGADTIALFLRNLL